ncbi:Polyadenylate-binding protein 1 [Wickerhamomyces ciferrii]|uniref:Polyadenylate-binding protein 1 n=1 Tax=Wickerhamomyces ciferrii (strain ATCC 14091 / BCRC 22168 / CBS 111 / JCM 3599 / NBRC 0793 / NRRL Y-1031 F-60-10) TaxID=1206466 RepID=K0KRQ6_WICCF|nr:Polyadenylate-binding protein 1 [Wickerhamomyces ciferrii]CCH45776.1 Polyadenylate-binding protein 1 [Wickerhamomyces ciferrii]
MFTNASSVLRAVIHPAIPTLQYQCLIRSFGTFGTEAVFLSGLPPNINQFQLKKFYKYNTTGLKDVQIFNNSPIGKSQTTGLLLYYKKSQAYDAIKKLNNVEISPGYPVELKLKPIKFNNSNKLPHLESNKTPIQNYNEKLHGNDIDVTQNTKTNNTDQNTTLYITNLPKNITIMKLKRIFGVYGIVLNIDIKVDLDESIAKVEFKHSEKANEAKFQLSNILEGKAKSLFSGRVPKIQFEIQQLFQDRKSIDSTNNTNPTKNSKINFSPIFRNDFKIKSKEEELSDSETQEQRFPRSFKTLSNIQNINIPNLKLDLKFEKKFIPGLTKSLIERNNDIIRPRMTQLKQPTTYNTLKGQIDDYYRGRKYKNRVMSPDFYK